MSAELRLQHNLCRDHVDHYHNIVWTTIMLQKLASWAQKLQSLRRSRGSLSRDTYCKNFTSVNSDPPPIGSTNLTNHSREKSSRVCTHFNLQRVWGCLDNFVWIEHQNPTCRGCGYLNRFTTTRVFLSKNSLIIQQITGFYTVLFLYWGSCSGNWLISSKLKNTLYELSASAPAVHRAQNI